jgi:GNAT superfamily N-acetyltransferase
MPPSSITISPLARHRQHLPLLVSWFRQEWPGWYGPSGSGCAESDLQSFAASESKLPVGLVVLQDGFPVGVGALKAESLHTHRHLSPWAAAGFVLPALRGQGIGAALLGALASHGYRLGYSSVYCGTATAVSLLRRSGWTELERIEHEGEPLVIFEKAAA